MVQHLMKIAIQLFSKNQLRSINHIYREFANIHLKYP